MSIVYGVKKKTDQEDEEPKSTISTYSFVHFLIYTIHVGQCPLVLSHICTCCIPICQPWAGEAQLRCSNFKLTWLSKNAT